MTRRRWRSGRDNSWEEAISRHANTKAAQGLPVTVAGVLSEALEIPKAHQDPKAAGRVRATLERLGWAPERPRLEGGTRPRRYVKKMPSAANEPQGAGGAAKAAG